MTRTLDDRLSRDVETASTLSTRGESASPCHLRSSEPSLTMQLGVREYAGKERGLRPTRAIDRSCSDAAAEECLMRGELVAGNSVRRESDDLGIRINELGTKSTQLLQFLSFAIIGAATLRTAQFAADQTLVRAATWWWILAVFPILLAVLPVKDFRWNGRTWYRFLVWVKCLLLWVAVIFSGVGAVQFLRAMS